MNLYRNSLYVVLPIMAFTLFAVADDTTIVSGGLTQADIIDTSETSEWTGVYGEVSGVRTVGGQNSLFEWEDRDVRYVYFSQEDPDFDAEWMPGNHSLMEQEYSFLENSSTGAETFNISFEVDSRFQNDTVNTIAAETFDGGGDKAWVTAYLYDGSNGFFTGNVSRGSSFNSEMVDYQVILPMRSNQEIYSVWVELDR